MLDTFYILNKKSSSEYIIESVTSRREDYINEWHNVVTGKICSISKLDCDLGLCVLRVYDYSEDNAGFNYWLSRVEDCVESDDGTLTITTMNSIYVLKDISRADYWN